MNKAVIFYLLCFQQCKMDDRTNYTRLISSYKYNDGSKLMKLRFRFEKEGMLTLFKLY